MKTICRIKEIIDGLSVGASPLDVRTPTREVEPHLRTLETSILPKMLCKDMYQDMANKRIVGDANYVIELSPDGLTTSVAFPNDPLYELLYTGYILPYASWYIYSSRLPRINSRLGNGMPGGMGISKAESTKDAMAIQAAISTTNVLQKDTLAFLEANRSEYPLYCPKQDCSPCGNLKTSTFVSISGFG